MLCYKRVVSRTKQTSLCLLIRHRERLLSCDGSSSRYRCYLIQSGAEPPSRESLGTEPLSDDAFSRTGTTLVGSLHHRDLLVDSTMTMSTSIFNMSSTNSTSPKLNFSHAELSSKYLDPSQLPTKGVPFRQIGNIPFIKHVRICMPASVRKSINPNDAGDRILKGGGGLFPSLHHVKVTMTLKDILDDENLRRGKSNQLLEIVVYFQVYTEA